MKSHHTITITIPTAKIMQAGLGVLAGLAIGLAVIAIIAAGVEVWTPVLGLPLLGSLQPVPVLQAAAPAPVEPWTPPTDYDGAHPAIVAFQAVPMPVRHAIDAMVERVLIEKYMKEAA